ncbi:hypothetical protein BCV70DRAFT_239534 [Testicularia cyperi]|uniref:Uncharacterized protein n=1 Tax=Testicularia cyperi TaxID=1882483 RepID=A0A317XGZ8_9BASI|nr:hypothetical protein BCV70DRAFT_239534 [Testicularia cyperi]
MSTLSSMLCRLALALFLLVSLAAATPVPGDASRPATQAVCAIPSCITDPSSLNRPEDGVSFATCKRNGDGSKLAMITIAPTSSLNSQIFDAGSSIDYYWINSFLQKQIKCTYNSVAQCWDASNGCK